MSYGYEYEEPDPAGSSASTAGRGRRRKASPQPEPGSGPSGQPQPPYPRQQPDAQWEQSGLGWDQQAWREAQQREARRTEAPYAGQGYPGEPYAPEQYLPDQRGSGEHGPEEYGRESFGEYQYTEEHYRAEQRGDQYVEEYEQYTETGRFEPAPDVEMPHGPDFDSVYATDDALDGAPASSAAGQGAFGAAGLAVVTGVGAIVATPMLAVVIGLSQIGLAIGWARSAGAQNSRRTVVLMAAVGLVASVLAYRLVPDRAPAAIGAALGAGFVFLAADQLFRRDAGAVRHHRTEALAAAVTGAAFTVLPAGYIVAQRDDAKLAGACALAAAVAVLASALVGGGNTAAGALAGAVAATGVGALTAITLSASAGTTGGAFGGLLSGVCAIVGARAAYRLGAEGSDVRIGSQAMPVAFSAIGAVIAAQMMR